MARYVFGPMVRRAAGPVLAVFALLGALVTGPAASAATAPASTSRSRTRTKNGAPTSTSPVRADDRVRVAPALPELAADPGSVIASNFSQAWSQADLGVQLLNTVLYSVVASALSTFGGLLIAFPIARRLLRGHSLLYTFMFVGLFLPFSVIPLFAEARMLSLYNNRPGYILLHVEPGLPLAVILLVAAISSIGPNWTRRPGWRVRATWPT